MKKIYPFLCLVLLLLACNKTNSSNSESLFRATVVVDYGEEKNMKQIGIQIPHQITALEALQYVSTVETHPVGKYVFVSSIDSVKTEIGINAWYYKVNGESPGVLAINNMLHDEDTVKWIYKTDVCSKTAENITKK